MAGKQSTPTRAHVKRSRAPHHPATHATNLTAGADADTIAVEEIRRSGRANKGHHTKNNDALDEPSPVAPKPAKSTPKPEKIEKHEKIEKKAPEPPMKSKTKGQAVRAQSTQSGDQDEEEEDALIRCVCGDQRDIRGRQMICCDTCEAWQHNKCLGLPEGDFWDGKDYYCEQCKPQDHQELLAAMARGEKPWARKKGSKPKPRPSDVKQETASEKATTPQPSATPSQTAGAPAEASSPTPAPVSAEDANGHADPKVCCQ